jgi:Flp pilus assembly protein TadG
MTAKSQIVKRRAGRARHRLGAAMIEAAIVLTSLFILTVGLLDFAVGVYRYHILSEAARQLARNAIVHGEFSTVLGKWGPTAYSNTANASHPIANAVRPYLVGIDPAAVSVAVQWPEGSNQVEKSIRVTLTTAFHPVLTNWFGSSMSLRAQSEMKIAH